MAEVIESKRFRAAPSKPARLELLRGRRIRITTAKHRFDPRVQRSQSGDGFGTSFSEIVVQIQDHPGKRMSAISRLLVEPQCFGVFTRAHRCIAKVREHVAEEFPHDKRPCELTIVTINRQQRTSGR